MTYYDLDIVRDSLALSDYRITDFSDERGAAGVGTERGGHILTVNDKQAEKWLHLLRDAERFSVTSPYSPPYDPGWDDCLASSVLFRKLSQLPKLRELCFRGVLPRRLRGLELVNPLHFPHLRKMTLEEWNTTIPQLLNHFQQYPTLEHVTLKKLTWATPLGEPVDRVALLSVHPRSQLCS